jgi:hypothetical protein
MGTNVSSGTSIGALRGVLPALAAVFALGLGYSGIYPLIMTLAGQAFQSSAMVGIVSTSAGIGSFLSLKPPVCGPASSFLVSCR